MRAALRLSRPIVLAVTVLLLSLLGGRPQALTFDGKTDSASLVGDQRLLGGNIGTLELTVTMAPKAMPGPILEFSGAVAAFQMSYNDAGTGLRFRSAGADYEIAPPGFNLAQPHTILLNLVRAETRSADDVWQVSIDGKLAGLLPKTLPPKSGGTPLDTDFIPTPGERLELALGGTGFTGSIDRFEVRTPDNLLYAGLSSSGAPVRRTLPILGAYLRTDSDVGVRQANLAPQIPAVHHGIFQKTTYYSLSRVPAGMNRGNGPDLIMLAVDWGGFVVMKPDPDNPRRYKSEKSSERWVGSLDFESDTREAGRKVRFRSVGSQAVQTRPFLQDGITYELAPGRPNGLDRDDAKDMAMTVAPRQTQGYVFNIGGTPPNFNFSMAACYDVLDMNLENFQETGCQAFPIFAAPDEEGAYKAAAPHILPLGWNWLVNASSEAMADSNLASTSEEIATAFTGSSSKGFTAMGYSQSHNENTKHEEARLAASERMVSISQSFRRAQSIVLAPTEVELDQCLIHSVLRAAATEFGRIQGVTPDALPDWAMPHGPAYYDPVEAESRCEGARTDPLSVQTLLSKYGTHYAHAITYGSRTVARSEYSLSNLRTLIQDGMDLHEAEGFEFNATVSAGSDKMGGSVSVPVKIGGSREKSTNSNSGSTSESSIKRERSSILCYGSPCADGLPQEGGCRSLCISTWSASTI